MKDNHKRQKSEKEICKQANEECLNEKETGVKSMRNTGETGT